MFGCIPRNVFAEQDQIVELISSQETDLALMTSNMTRRIVNNTAELNNNSSDCRRSTIMGITFDPPNFNFQKSIYISDLVAEKVARRHIKDLWNEVSAAENSPDRGLLFEASVRSLLMNGLHNVRARNASGRSSQYYKRYLSEELGGCNGIERTDDMVEACKTGRERVIYYSYCESEPLVECMYKVGKCYYAIQVTISDSHDCGGENDGKIIDDFFEKIDLKDDEELNLIYAVPFFCDSLPNPVNPKYQQTWLERPMFCMPRSNAHVDVI